MMDFYKAGLDELLVVMDDLALRLGQLRFRLQGSAGGHNGLNDILRALGSRDVPRLRIGIGQPPGRMDPADFVLSRFRSDEQEIIDVAIRQAADAVTDWMFLDPRVVMETYNRKPPEE
jgi:PTH1 family peptidyl-tRNA hydrolase